MKNMNWKILLVLLVIILLVLLLIINFKNRYVITYGDPRAAVILKLDKWTGKSWMLWQGEWTEIKQGKTKREK